MDNQELAKTIMSFLQFAVASSSSPMKIFMNPHDDQNMIFIQEWIIETQKNSE